MHVLNPSPETVKIPANFQKKALPDSGRVRSTSQGAWSCNWVRGRWFPDEVGGVHRRSSPAVAGWAPRPQVRITRPRKSRFSCPPNCTFSRTGMMNELRFLDLFTICTIRVKEDPSATAARVHVTTHVTAGTL